MRAHMQASTMLLRVGPINVHPVRARTSLLRNRRRPACLPVSARAATTLTPATVVTPDSPTSSGNPMLGVLNNALLQQAEVQRQGLEEKPGEADARNFKLHWSVDFWKHRSQSQDLAGTNTNSSGTVNKALEFIESLTSNASKAGVFASPTATAYWAYHLTRTGFLAVQGLSGLFATQAAARAEGNPEAAERSKVGQMFNTKSPLAPFVEPLTMYYQDYKNIEAGMYKLPWDMTTLRNKQYDPLHVLNTAASFAYEASNTLRRRFQGAPEEVWLQSSMYPKYYLNTFHYQTDGWLSEKSASIYEASTETLFLGRQDAMQRQSLVPLHNFMQGRGREGAGTKMLEVACGTGRFATFVKDNYPRMDYTALDLSPYYLYEARNNIKNWHRLRQPNLKMGGVDGSGTHFLQAAAESIPQDDASHDVVLSIYLFHELPPEVRRAAAKDMVRVLKPGGLLILTDSVQLGDRSSFDASIGRFGDFNEPYYRSFIAEDFGQMFKDCGLECDEKLLGSSTKVLSFRKPL
ncbi:hypothetical protein ABBQ38_000156 [Trebouxia sp. C0009 RCD-2024]